MILDPAASESPHPRKVKPKVIHISTVHSARDVRIFYKEARSLAEEGYDVTVAASGGTPADEQGVRIIPLGSEGGSRWRRFPRLFRAMRLMLREHGAILHLHDPELLLAAIIPSLLGRWLVFDVHEFYVPHIAHAAWLPRWARKPVARIYDWLERLILARFSGVVIAVESMRERYAGILSPERIALVRNFPYIREDDVRRVTAQPHPLQGRPYIVHTGGASHLRAFHVMIEAAERLRWHNCDWPIVNIGEIDLSGYAPRERRELLARATAAGIQNVGPVTQDEAWRYCSHACIGGIFLAPLENYMRALPIKLFEYWFFGLPVIAPDMGQLAVYIKQWRAGLLFPPTDGAAAGDLFLRLACDPNWRQQLSRLASQAGVHYNFKSEARSLVCLYERIADSRATPGAGGATTALNTHPPGLGMA